MRLIPIVAAATIGLFATAAVAQNMNTADPNSAPGASATGGKPVKRPSAAEIKRMDTADPNSAPGASATGGKPKPASAAEIKGMNTRSEQRHHQRAEHGRQAQGQEKEDEQYVTNGKSVWLNAAAPEKRGGFFVAGGRYVILAARNGPVYSMRRVG